MVALPFAGLKRRKLGSVRATGKDLGAFATDQREAHIRDRRNPFAAIGPIVLAYVAGQEVPLDDSERNAALRRALFVFAAGGPLNRDPGLDDPAVVELAGDPEAIGRLRDPQTAWRAYACSLLADALAEDEEL